MSAESGRILVVDDVPESARLLQALLEPCGCAFVAATDGGTALVT